MSIRTVPIAPDKGDVAATTTNDHGRLTVTGMWPDKKRVCANGTELSGFGPNTTVAITIGEPNSCIWSGERSSRYRRAGWDCELRIAFEVTSTAREFTAAESILALRDGKPVFERKSSEAIPRDCI